MERMSGHTGLISSYQLLITAACTNTPEQLTGAHLYLDIVMSGYLCHTVGNVMDLQLCWLMPSLSHNGLTKEQIDEKWMKRMNAVFAPFSRFELTRCVLIIYHFLWDPLNQRLFNARMKYYIKTTLNVITYSYPQFEYTMLLEEITGIHGGKWKLWR